MRVSIEQGFILFLAFYNLEKSKKYTYYPHSVFVSEGILFSVFFRRLVFLLLQKLLLDY